MIHGTIIRARADKRAAIVYPNSADEERSTAHEYFTFIASARISTLAALNRRR